MCGSSGTLPDPGRLHQRKGGIGAPDPLNFFTAPEQPTMPAVVQESPVADASTAADTAKQEAVKSRLATTRRRRALSLLAQGGEGDTKQPITATPAATAGKQQLGA